MESGYFCETVEVYGDIDNCDFERDRQRRFERTYQKNEFVFDLHYLSWKLRPLNYYARFTELDDNNISQRSERMVKSMRFYVLD